MKRGKVILGIIPIVIAMILVGCGISQPTNSATAITNASNSAVLEKPNSIVSATNNTLPSQVADIIHQKYGEIRNIFRIGDDWALTTLGNQKSNGVIGLYRCSPTDIACLNGQTPLLLDGWTFYEAPFSRGVTLMRETGNTLIIDNGGHQITFDVATHSYNSKP